MTNYSFEDLENNWEFKIVRSERGAFHKAEVFQQLMQEEALAGWEMVEKLDNRRVRFKRRKDARRRDATLPQGVDPYRIQFDGGASRSLVLVLIGLLMMVTMGGGALFLALRGGGGAEVSGDFPWIAAANAGVIALVFVIMLVTIIARRK